MLNNGLPNRFYTTVFSAYFTPIIVLYRKIMPWVSYLEVGLRSMARIPLLPTTYYLLFTTTFYLLSTKPLKDQVLSVFHDGFGLVVIEAQDDRFDRDSRLSGGDVDAVQVNHLLRR